MVKAKPKGKTFTLRKKGKKPAVFHTGKLHRALGVAEDEKIPEGKKNAALAGRYGPAVKKMAVAAFKGILAKGRKTAVLRTARPKGRKKTKPWSSQGKPKK